MDEFPINESGMRTEPAKQLLTSVNEGDGFYLRSYNMNLYRGCSHGCIYCDSRSVCYQMKDFDTVRVKENALGMLRDELKRKRNAGLVGMGAASDSYNPFEREWEVTRGALFLLAEYGFGVGITTKSSLVARDIDAFQAIMRYAPANIVFSITAADDELSGKIEPNVAVTSERFGAMAKLADSGILAGVWLNPVLPFLTDDWENIRAILRATKDAGGKYAMCHFGMTLREGNREYFYAALDRLFPGLKHRYADAYGLQYEIPIPGAREISKLFYAECDRLGLKHEFRDINVLIRASGGADQMSLF